MAVNDADRSRDESAQPGQDPNATKASAVQSSDEAPTPESEAAAMPISEPVAESVSNAGVERDAAGAQPAVEQGEASVESPVPPLRDPDPGPVAEFEAEPAPALEASARSPLGPEPTARRQPSDRDASGLGRPAGPADASGLPPGAETSAPPPSGGAARSEARSEWRQNLGSRTTWLRLVYMVLFVVLWGLSRIVLGAVVIMQFLWVLFSGESNPRLAELGQALATYSYEIILYLTYNTERQPFPFSDWPSGPPRY